MEVMFPVLKNGMIAFPRYFLWFFRNKCLVGGAHSKQAGQQSHTFAAFDGHDSVQDSYCSLVGANALKVVSEFALDVLRSCR